MKDTLAEGYIVPELLVPAKGTSKEKWSVIACDQYTSQPEYWQKALDEVGTCQSALHLILPEVYLGDNDVNERTEKIRETMHQYLNDGVLRELPPGIMLTERDLPGGKRRGLLLAMDLDSYSWVIEEHPMIRASEKTVLERIPPRVKARKGAPIEMPHIMLLIDDPNDTVIGPLAAKTDRLEPVYDFDLMMGGGHIKGWLAANDADLDGVQNALAKLPRPENMLYCVGDGNHSLATAKTIWDEYKKSIPESERAASPLRYALCEVVNLHEPAVEFLPIHRVFFNVDAKDLTSFVIDTLNARGEQASVTDEPEAAFDIEFLSASENGTISIAKPSHPLAAGVLQPVFDEYLEKHPDVSVDYIHGDEALEELSRRPDALGFRFPPVSKNGFFELLIRCGVLPRKTFSIGEADDKRFYLEARALAHGEK